MFKPCVHNRFPLAVPAILLLFSASLPFLGGCDNDLEVAEAKSGEETVLVDTEGPQPKVVVDQPLHEFGAMEVGETLTHEFVIRNEGEDVLKLIKDRSTCKCTMADFKVKELQPGESFNVKLEWIGKAEDPQFSQAAYIKTNDPENEEISLTVSGRVDSTFDITPAGVWNLGELSRKEPTPFSGTITSHVLDEFEIAKTEVSNDLIAVNIVEMTEEELKEDDLKTGYRIEGKVKPGAPMGEFTGKVTLHVQGNDDEYTANFEVKGYVSGPVQIVGPSGWKATEMLFIMGRFDRDEGNTVNLSMFLRDNDGQPVKVTDVKTEPDFLEFSMKHDEKFKAENRERYIIQIKVPAGAPSMNLNRENPGKIYVKTDSPLLEEMVFQIHGLSF